MLLKYQCAKCRDFFDDEKECIAHEQNCASMVVLNNKLATIDETRIVCIIDRSGSMDDIKKDAIGGFNTFIEEQKKLPGKATLTLTLFNHDYDVLYLDKPLNDVQLLDNSTYIPRGTTALLDAVGRTITDVESKSNSDKVIVTILTDGLENASKDYDKPRILEMIQRKRNDGWEFVFLAANQDAFSEANSLGINQAVNFTADASGTRSAYKSINERVVSYRTA
jgi:hypothetical protein